MNTSSYKTTIGLEIHVELKTKTKMFCNSKNDPHMSAPNMHVCPVCLAHPGTLPVINKEAVSSVLKVGIALKSELATYTEFDRKNYFYPDIPKGYQISQYKYPLVRGGELNGIAITRVHLEEDTARSLHDQGDGSLVDYNRAGVPLMELVTEPVIHDAKTAGSFARELQLLLRTLGVSNANMERGEMRVEANISVSKTDTFGTKVEVKNLNSFKAMESAIDYEVQRHITALEEGVTLIQETRGWDENKGKTFSQRVKESAHEYRYFPDPDIPKLDLSLVEDLSLSRLKESMALLPSEKRLKYSNLDLTREQIELVISDFELEGFFEKFISSVGLENVQFIKTGVNYLTSDLRALLSESNTRINLSSIPHFVTLIQMVSNGLITSRVAKDVLKEVCIDCLDPATLIESRGLSQNNSDADLTELVRLVISENLSVANEFKSGKTSALQFLLGQCMRKSNGSANPTLLKVILTRELTA